MYQLQLRIANRTSAANLWQGLLYNDTALVQQSIMSYAGRVTCCICTGEDIPDWCSLDCGHLFHVPCIEQWLENNRICPFCRVSPLIRLERPLFACMATSLRLYKLQPCSNSQCSGIPLDSSTSFIAGQKADQSAS